MFSDADIEADIRALFAEDQSEDFIRGAINRAHRLRMLVHAKITSGELRVVKSIPRDQFLRHVTNDCPVDYDMLSFLDTGFQNILDFCPGCGAQIVE